MYSTLINNAVLHWGDVGTQTRNQKENRRRRGSADENREVRTLKSKRYCMACRMTCRVLIEAHTVMGNHWHAHGSFSRRDGRATSPSP